MAVRHQIAAIEGTEEICESPPDAHGEKRRPLHAAAAVIAEAATRAGLPRFEAERTAWSGIRTTGRLAYA